MDDRTCGTCANSVGESGHDTFGACLESADAKMGRAFRYDEPLAEDIAGGVGMRPCFCWCEKNCPLPCTELTCRSCDECPIAAHYEISIASHRLSRELGRVFEPAIFGFVKIVQDTLGILNRSFRKKERG